MQRGQVEESMNATDLSADVGLVAVAIVTTNLLVGCLMAMRYSPWRCWPRRRFDIFRLHRWTGYASLALVILHPVPLLFSTSRFRVVDILFPVHSPSQPLENSIGAVALYCVVLVVVTSYFRLQLGRRLWKAFHFVIYVAGIAIFWHSILTDPTLKHTPVDPLDGEKVFVEACCLLVVVVVALRWRYAVRKTAARTRTMQISEKAA
jgi:predicted ferric reductase